MKKQKNIAAKAAKSENVKNTKGVQVNNAKASAKAEKSPRVPKGNNAPADKAVTTTKVVGNAAIISGAENILKDILKSLRAADKERNSLSQVLVDIRRLWNKGYGNAFAVVGITDKDPKVFNPARIKNAICDKCLVKDKTGKQQIGLWGYRSVKNDKGEVIDREAVCRVVHSWSPAKLLRVLAQSVYYDGLAKSKEEAEAKLDGKADSSKKSQKGKTTK